MNQQPVRHSKVQFSKRELRDLGDFPSAREHDSPPIKSKKGPPKRVPRAGRFLASLALVLLVVAGAGYALLRHGLAGDVLTRRAADVVRSMAGPDFDVTLDGASVTLTGKGRLAIATGDLAVSRKSDGSDFANIGRIDLGLSAIALLRGDVEVSAVSVSSGTLVMPPMAGAGPASINAIEPDAVLDAVFSHIERFLGALDGPRISAIDVSDIRIDLASLGIADAVMVTAGRLTRTGDGGVTIEADLTHAGSSSKVDITARRVAGIIEASGRIGGLAFNRRSDGKRDGERIADIRTVAGTAALGFKATGTPGSRKLLANVSVPDLSLTIRDRVDTTGAASINLEISEGAGKIELRPSLLRLGKSAVRFDGAVGPESSAAPGSPAYRFEIVANEAVMEPSDSPEPPARFAARVAGQYIPADKRLIASHMALKTANGEAIGEASVSFSGAEDPAVFLALRVPSMPVSELKQFWPATAGNKARDIAFSRVVGGTVVDGRLELNVQADRLGSAEPLRQGELKIETRVTGARVDTVGDLPPLRDAVGTILVEGIDTTIAIERAVAYMPSGRTANVTGARLLLREPKSRRFFGDLEVSASGQADAIAELLSLKPIHGASRVPFAAADVTGSISGKAAIRFPISVDGPRPDVTYDVALDFTDLAIAKPVEGQKITDGRGTLKVDNRRAEIVAKAKLNGIPAELKLVEPMNGASGEAVHNVALELDDETRKRIAPGLNTIVKGPIYVDLSGSKSAGDAIVADLTKAELDLPFAGWKKSAGIAATAGFNLKREGTAIAIRDFSLKGKSFAISGDIDLDGGNLQSARFGRVQLNGSDSVAIAVSRGKGGYQVTIEGDSLDIRALVKQAKDAFTRTVKNTKDIPVRLRAKVNQLTGFNREVLRNVIIDYEGQGSRIDRLQINAASDSGGAVVMENILRKGRRTLQLESTDAGAVLRFLDIYPRMRGGRISISLASDSDGPLSGNVEARDFKVIDEPRLASLVSKPSRQGTDSLATSLRKEIDTSEVAFDQGSFAIRKGKGYLDVDKGILRGNLIGTTFSGSLYDKNGAMDIRGTFMPAYGINRLFGDIPILGEILGNGSDKGLIGITYKLAGPAKNPNVLVNPVSVIAPGIFRQIFEYR